jgi:hypothetical protein
LKGGRCRPSMYLSIEEETLLLAHRLEAGRDGGPPSLFGLSLFALTKSRLPL